MTLGKKKKSFQLEAENVDTTERNATQKVLMINAEKRQNQKKKMLRCVTLRDPPDLRDTTAPAAV